MPDILGEQLGVVFKTNIEKQLEKMIQELYGISYAFEIGLGATPVSQVCTPPLRDFTTFGKVFWWLFYAVLFSRNISWVGRYFRKYWRRISSIDWALFWYTKKRNPQLHHQRILIFEYFNWSDASSKVKKSSFAVTWAWLSWCLLEYWGTCWIRTS